MGSKILALIAVVIPVFGVSFIVSRMVKQLVKSTLRRTEGKPVRRAGAAALGAAVVAGLVWVWWPHGNYRVIQPDERGVLQQAFAPAAVTQVISHTATTDSAAAYRVVHEGDRLQATTVWPAGVTRPTPGHPTLAMVLTPRDPSKPTWVFPFNRPAPPGPGDNQAMAIATKNGSTVYDVAFALVYADKDTVLNKNEAYAFASCKKCTAVAVAFQVVLIVGQRSRRRAREHLGCRRLQLHSVRDCGARHSARRVVARASGREHDPETRCPVGEDPGLRQAPARIDVPTDPRPARQFREPDPRDRQAVRTCDSDSIGIGEHGGTVVERPGTGTAGRVVVGRDSVVVRAGLVVGRRVGVDLCGTEQCGADEFGGRCQHLGGGVTERLGTAGAF